ncbi:hypothetical protein EI94DRAFT_1797844 [Lactarius quietus]|nr:hypothetical protein EI94DRAFT_1797844 [Lactarius quietus]
MEAAYDNSRTALLGMRAFLNGNVPTSEEAETWARDFSDKLNLVEVLSQGEPNKGRRDPEVNQLVVDIRNAIRKFANSRWLKHSPVLVEGMEDVLERLAEFQPQESPRSQLLARVDPIAGAMQSPRPSVPSLIISSADSAGASSESNPPHMARVLAMSASSVASAAAREPAPLSSGQPSAADSPKIPSPEKVYNAASSATGSKGSAGTRVAGKKDAMSMLLPTEVPKAKSGQAKGASGKSMEAPVLVSTSPLPSFDGTPVEKADSQHDEEIQRQREKVMSSARAAVLQTDIVLGKAEAEAGAMRVRDARKKLELMDDDLESFSSSSGEEEEEDEEREAKKVKMGRTIFLISLPMCCS